METKKIKEFFSKIRKYCKCCMVILLCAIVVIIVYKVVHGSKQIEGPGFVSDAVTNIIMGKEGEVHTITEASLEKVFAISELATADYTYNAIAKAYEEDGTTVKYYVAYEGKVKAGIDFSKINIDLDEEEKKIIITIPDVEFQEKTVDPGTLEFIFKNKKSETETVHQEAFRLCEKDLEERIGGEKELKDLAKENAMAVVEALVTPWVMQADEGYSVDIR